jgi:hypothetical protein
VIAGCSIDQLRGDAQAVTDSPDTASNEVLHVEIAADPFHVDVLATKLEGRIAGDDEQRAEPGQAR